MNDLPCSAFNLSTYCRTCHRYGYCMQQHISSSLFLLYELSNSHKLGSKVEAKVLFLAIITSIFSAEHVGGGWTGLT